MARLIERLLNAGALRRWGYAARTAQSMPLSQLRLRRNQARSLRAHLDQLIHVADGRLALPMIGTSYFPRPHGTDWAWRPELWRGPLPVPGMSSVPAKTPLGGEVTLFHDCRRSELTLRQTRNLRESDLAPFGLQMDVFRFDGSFLSLVVDLPEAAIAGLRREHLLRLGAIIETERPIEIFARLNIRHGPNTEQLVRELPHDAPDALVEFDLAYSRLNEKRVERAWLDLIFETPDMNQVTLRDLTFARYRRAAL